MTEATPGLIPSTVLVVAQHSASVMLFGLVAYWYVYPYLALRPPRSALIALTLPQFLRHVGWPWAVPGVLVDPRVPSAFGWWIVGTDTTMLLLAVWAVVALRRRSGVARWLLAAMNLFGIAVYLFNLIDWLIRAISPLVGAQLFVVGFVVPVLEICQAMSLLVLFRNWSTLDSSASH